MGGNQKFKVFSFYSIGIILITILFFKYLPSNNSTLYINGDYLYQHVPFYTEFYRLLDNGLPQWSWNLFLGGDFWASKSYYLIGDPFAWFSYLINKYFNNVVYSMYLVTILKYITAFSSFYLFLINRKTQFSFTFIIALFYAFSGWSVLFIEQPVFISFYALLPLLFFSFDNLFYKNQKLLFILIVALLISTNFYLFWVSAIMLLIYYLFIYFHRSDKKSEHCIKIFFEYLSYILIGVMICTVVWLPGIINILNNERIGNLTLDFNYYSIQNILSIILFTLIPKTFMYFSAFNSNNYTFNQISLYVGTFSLLLLPHYVFIQKNRKDKIRSILVLTSLILLVSSPYIGLLFHFTFSLRYTFLHTFFFLLIASEVLKNSSLMKIKNLILVEISYLFIWFFVRSQMIDIYTTEINFLNHAILLSITYNILFIIYQFQLKNNSFKFISIFLMLVVSTYEIYSLAIPTLDLAFVECSDVIENYEHTEFRDILYSVKVKENTFFRIFFSGSGNNISNIKDFHSIEAYDSTYNYSISTFLRWIGFEPSNQWIFDFYSNTSFKLLNVKYAIDVLDYDTGFIPNNFIYFNNSKYSVYHYLETAMAYTFNQYSSYEQMNLYIENSNPQIYETTQKLESTLYFENIPVNIDNYVNSVSNYQTFDPIGYTDNSMSFEIDLTQNQMLFFSIPNSGGWKVFDNEQEIDIYDVQGGFIGLLLEKGNHNIEFVYNTPGLKTGAILSILSILLIVLISLLKFIKRF